MTELEQPVSQTARDIIAKLHPAIKEDWRLKLLRVETEAVAAYIRGAPKSYGVDDEGPE